MAETSYKLQEQKLDELKFALHKYCELINLHKDNWRRELHNCMHMGMPIEVVEYYNATFLNPVEQEIESIIVTIQREHNEYINGVIASLQRNF